MNDLEVVFLSLFLVRFEIRDGRYVLGRFISLEDANDILFNHFLCAAFAVKSRLNSRQEVEHIYQYISLHVNVLFAPYFNSWVNVNSKHLAADPIRLNKEFVKLDEHARVSISLAESPIEAIPDAQSIQDSAQNLSVSLQKEIADKVYVSEGSQGSDLGSPVDDFMNLPMMGLIRHSSSLREVDPLYNGSSYIFTN
jgi:hypothetical protein